jgi:PAS domain S-box-containing protein
MNGMKKTADAASAIFRDESLRIKEFLRKNSRGMNIREISEALRINRNSVAKYMDVLTTREEVEFKSFGKSKVYFLSQHVPVSALGRFSSTLMVILNRDQRIVQINDPFLRVLDLPRESVIGSAARDVDCALLRNEDVIAWSAEALQGKEVTNEISLPENGSFQHFRVVLSPTQFADNTPGVILFFENITEKKQIRSALAESEQNFRTLLEGSGDGCLIIDEEGTIVTWNPALEEISGISSDQAIGSNVLDRISDLIIPEYRSKDHTERVRQSVLSLFMGKSPSFMQLPTDIPILRRDGQRRYVQQLSFPVMLGKKMHFGVIIRDVTEHRHTEEALVREKAFQNAVMDNVMGIFFVTDENEQFVRWNRNLEQVTGYNTYDLLRVRATDILAEDDRDCIRQRYGTILNEKMPGMLETQILTKEGRKIPFLINGVTTVIGDRKYRVSLGVDISKRKRAEHLLKQSEEKYRRIVETANEGIWGMDENFITTFVNGKIADRLGYTTSDMIGKHITEFMHPDELADNAVRVQNRREGKKETYERHLLRKDGRSCWMLVSASPLMDPEGNFEGSFAMMIDITKRREAEQVLRESEEQFRNLVERVPGLAVQGYYMDGTTFFWNKASENLYGYAAGEAIGRNLLDLIIPPEMRDGVQSAIAGMAASGEPIPSSDLILMRRDGSRVDVYSGHAIIRLPGKPTQLFCMDIDLTERKRAELAIHESEDRFDQVAKNADEWIWEVNAEGLYTYSSAAVERILGYLPEEIVGKMHYYNLFEPAVRDELRNLAQSVFGRHEPFRKFVNANIHKNGNIVFLETSGTPVFDKQGTLTGYRGCDTDVTERRNLEVARQEALQQIEKNIGQFAVLGDHIRNPLTVILAETCNMPAGSGEKITAQVREVDRIIHRIDQGWIESENVRLFLRKYYEIT